MDPRAWKHHSNQEGEAVMRLPEGTGRSPDQWVGAAGDKEQAEGQAMWTQGEP